MCGHCVGDDVRCESPWVAGQVCECVEEKAEDLDAGERRKQSHN